MSAVGDIILTTPALEALKTAWPATRVVFVTKTGFAGLVRHNPYVSKVIGLAPGEGLLAAARRLRAEGVTDVLDLHGKMRSTALARLVGARRRVTWTKRPWQDAIPVRMGLRPYRAAMTIAARYHAAVEALVGESLAPGSLRYSVGPEDQARADELLSSAGLLRDDAPILGLSPGANWATKRWPAERYAELARRATARGMRVLVTGSRDEASLCDEVARAEPRVTSLAGRLSLTELGGAIARCAAFVANDSGPMHMARGLGVPTLAVFGSTDPKQFSFAGHGLLFAGVACSPCHFYGRVRCPKGHFQCMDQLDVDLAWRTLEPLLSRGRVALVAG